MAQHLHLKLLLFPWPLTPPSLGIKIFDWESRLLILPAISQSKERSLSYKKVLLLADISVPTFTHPSAGARFTLNDLATARFEIYDSLTKAFHLLLTLSNNDNTLKQFEFILKWDSMSMEDKLEKYGKFASHELNFFVYKKDKKFFDQIVEPYLRNKKEKTFFDHWFLGEDLQGYYSPYKYNSLNVVEKILLGQRTNRSKRHHSTVFLSISSLP